MGKLIEVEIRGPLPEARYKKICETLKHSGQNVRTEHRILIDYSTGLATDTFENRTVDIRLRLKNDIPEIVVKRGKAGDWSAREEIITTLAKGEFSNAVKTFAALGYTKGMVCVREILHASYGGAEFSIADPGSDDLYYYEAEITASTDDEVKEARSKLDVLARKFGLPIWNEKEMFAFIRKLNESVNYKFDYDIDGPDHFKKKFNI